MRIFLCHYLSKKRSRTSELSTSDLKRRYIWGSINSKLYILNIEFIESSHFDFLEYWDFEMRVPFNALQVVNKRRHQFSGVEKENFQII